MKYTLLLILTLFTSVCYGAERITLQNGSGNEIGTASNPVVASVVGTVGDGTGAGSFTNLNTSGTSTLGDAIGDITTFTGKIAGATPMSFDGASADAVYTILAITDPTSASKTITVPAVTGSISLETPSTTVLTPGAAVTLTVVPGTNVVYTDASNDNEDQTITFSGAGTAGDEVTIIFATSSTGDEVITFHATLVSSVGTLTLGTTAARFYTVKFVSNGSHWYETTRTAVQT